MGHSIADNRDLTLWAESPEEARTFLARMRRSGHELQIRDVFVAKRSPRMRTNRYIDGRYFTAPAEYFLTTGDDDIDVFNTTVPAPARIQDLVQWCTCDVMLSRGATPIVVVEDTTHIVRMNLYQRVPRLARAAMLGVPSVVLQGTVGLEFRLRGDRWALYRYLQAFSAIARIYPTAPCLPLWYLPSEQDEREQEAILASHVQALVDVDTQKIAADRTEILAKVQRVLSEGVDGEVPPDLPSIDYAGAEVIVRIGAHLWLLQTALLGRKIKRTRLEQDPIFVIGHWRSGTTLLHELLVRDPRHTYPDTYACFAPNHFLISSWIIKPCLKFVAFAAADQPTWRPAGIIPRRMNSRCATWASPRLI